MLAWKVLHFSEHLDNKVVMSILLNSATSHPAMDHCGALYTRRKHR